MTKRLKLTFATEPLPQWERFKEEYLGPIRFQPFPIDHILEHTDMRWRLLCAIQREVNLIRYKRDPKGNDHWKLMLEKYGAGPGDCEDFALTKWALCIEAGFPAGSIWPVICLKGNQPHMVTVVVTQEQDFVMDVGHRNWIHDITLSRHKYLSAYDGEQWRLAMLVDES